MAAFFLDIPLFSLFSLVVFLLSLFIWLHTSSKFQKKLPPFPPKLPIIGNLHQLGLLPHRSLHSLSMKYGPLVLLRIGSKSMLVASSADAAREIMKTNDLIFSIRPKSSIPDRLFYGSKDIAFSPYGEYWRQMKRISMLHLLSNKRVQSFQHIREEETSLMVEKINGMCSSNSAVNLSDLFLTLTNDVLCRVAFGRKYREDEVGKKVMENLKVFVESMGIFDVGDYIPWLAWVNRFNGLDAKVENSIHLNDRFLEAVIEERMEREKKEPRSSDFVDILLEIQKEDLAGFTLERDTIKALILDMFAAGTDTTHSVMEWAMSELLRHPKILQKLQFEVREIAQGNGENAFTQIVLDKMHYLKAVIKETLRLHSPVALLVPRESTQDINLLGYDISAGTKVIVNAWAIGRDPMLWENPEEFQPERFLGSNIDFRGLNFEFIPFGAGRRVCPGINFAISLEELTLAKLVNKFNFSLPNGMRPEDLDMTEASGITVHRKLPLLGIATPYYC